MLNSKHLSAVISFLMTIISIPLLTIFHLVSPSLRDIFTYKQYKGMSNKEIIHYARLYWKRHRHSIIMQTVDRLLQF